MNVLDTPTIPTHNTRGRRLYQDEEDQRRPSAAGLQVSEAEYWATYYHDPDVSYEWNNGVLEEKPMADFLSFAMYSWFFSLVKDYLTAFPIAAMMGLEIGFRLALAHSTSIRRPDLALIRHTNPVPWHGKDCTYQGIVDLCIEFLSDSTPDAVRRDTVIKKREYCRAGVREYFILDRNGRETVFYRRTETGRYAPIPASDGIIRSEVLPGFQFRIRDLYEQPAFRTLVHDPVYREFLLLDYQREQQRAEAAEQRAEAERRERLRLAALLKEHGVEY